MPKGGDAPRTATPVPRGQLVDHVLRRMADDIVLGRLAPGLHLPEVHRLVRAEHRGGVDDVGHRRALELIPGGVNSPVRAMRAVGLDEPVFMARGEGAEIEDVDGCRYVDWVMSWGPLIFGHADPETIDAVQAANSR